MQVETDSEKEDGKHDELLAELTSMGFDLEESKKCLESMGTNMQKIIDFLSNTKSKNFDELKSNLNTVQPSCSKTQEFREKIGKAIDAQKLMSTLAEEMPEDDEAYLDFNTDEDLFFINKYYSLLES